MLDVERPALRTPRAPLGAGADPVKALTWEAFARDWAARTAEARDAADALRAGPVAPAVARCLPAHPTLRAAGLNALRACAEAPELGGLDDAPPPRDLDTLASPFEHRVGLYARQAGPHGGLAWILRELGFMAARTNDLEREGWDTPTDADPKRDLETAACWAAWASGSMWPQYGTFSRLFLPAARDAFRAVCAARAVPEHVREAALAELPHVFCTVMLGDKHAIPGIGDVALRLVERDAEGPLVALARQLPADAWPQVLGCLSIRGAWAGTWRALSRAGRVPADDPGFLDGVVSLHTSLRLLDLWRGGQTDPRMGWRVLRQNRGKVRGRLRALLAERLGKRLGQVVLGRDALYAQTRAAVAAYSLSWAWHELRSGLYMKPDNAVTPRCEAADPALLALDSALERTLRTWVLLVVLRGRLPHLQTWVETGQQTDKDTVFGRLLTEELPIELVDPGHAAGRRGYRQVRDALAVNLEEQLSTLLPTLRALAELPAGRHLKRDVAAALKPLWDRRVHFPERDFPDMQAHAAAACLAMGPSEEDPWNP